MPQQKQKSVSTWVVTGAIIGAVIAALSYVGYTLGASQSGLSDYTDMVSLGLPILVVGILIGGAAGLIGAKASRAKQD